MASHLGLVSILTGPEGPVHPFLYCQFADPVKVSILTGPEGPVHPSDEGGAYTLDWQFQSSPGPKARCIPSSAPGSGSGTPFQSSPGPKARCIPTPLQGAGFTAKISSG